VEWAQGGGDRCRNEGQLLQGRRCQKTWGTSFLKKKNGRGGSARNKGRRLLTGEGAVGERGKEPDSRMGSGGETWDWHEGENNLIRGAGKRSSRQKIQEGCETLHADCGARDAVVGENQKAGNQPESLTQKKQIKKHSKSGKVRKSGLNEGGVKTELIFKASMGGGSGGQRKGRYKFRSLWLI